MDSYAGTLDNPVSLHKYLYANANPAMYVDPSGNFSLVKTQVAQAIRSTLDSVVVPALNIQKLMSWANMAVTMHDIMGQVKLLFTGETTVGQLAAAIAKGMIKQTLLNCAAKAVLGDAAAVVLKLVGIEQDAESFIEAVKSGDPERITIESLRLATSLFALKCQCFTADTLVSTMDGERPISDLKAGDKVWSFF